MTCHLNLELARGDIPTTTYSLKKSSISREYQVMNKSNDVDFLLRLKSMSVFWGQPDRGIGVLCWDFIVYLGFQAFALFCKLPISSEYCARRISSYLGLFC